MGRKAKAKEQRREARKEAVWMPFVEVETAIITDVTKDGAQIRRQIKIADSGFDALYQNNRYTVLVRNLEGSAPFGPGIWLSIRRLDRQPIRDWRDMQRIKNELIGEEAEGVELYPAESRLVDTANQYHMYVFPKYKFPFGFNERLVDDSFGLVGSKQRKF